MGIFRRSALYAPDEDDEFFGQVPADDAAGTPVMSKMMAWGEVRRRRCRLPVFVYSVPGVCVGVLRRRRCRLTVFVYSIPVCFGVLRRRRCRLNTSG